MRPGDKIIEINGKRNLRNKEFSQILDSNSAGDLVELRVVKSNGKEVLVKAKMEELSEAKNVTYYIEDIEVIMHDVCSWWGIRISRSKKKIKVKKNELSLFEITRVEPFRLLTKSDNVSHDYKESMVLEFDKNLDYEIKYN